MTKINGCIFVDTPKECSFTVKGNCTHPVKLRCIFHRQHLIIADDAKPELLKLLEEEMNTSRRYKKLSGLNGRIGVPHEFLDKT